MSDLSTTAILLEKIANGDQAAPDKLVSHCYPMLLKWAHGRVPYSEQGLIETSDLVQETFIKGMSRIDQFESLRPGAFLAYLRRIFINCVIDTVRKSKPTIDIDDFFNSRTHFSSEVDYNQFINYENALSKLGEEEQEAIILRIEFGLTYKELSEAMAKPSEDAARMYVNRAIQKLAKHVK